VQPISQATNHETENGGTPVAAIEEVTTVGTTIRVWEIESESVCTMYTVRLMADEWDCTCPGFTFHGKCKHVARCKQIIELEEGDG
jgi:uncharacterized Zn finger protein